MKSALVYWRRNCLIVLASWFLIRRVVALVSWERGTLVEARKVRMELRCLERKKFCEQFVYLLGGREDTGKFHLRSYDVGVVNVFRLASV